MKEKFWILGVILAVLIVALIWLDGGWSKSGDSTATTKTTTQSPVATSTQNASGTHTAVAISNVATTTLPQRFPTDIPLEAGAKITYNYNAVNASGKFQSTREFISVKTMAQNFALYQADLKSSDWTITQAFADTAHDQDIILATKPGNDLNIRIYTVSGQVRVAISDETNP